ncbi:SDR family oxidoreductase [Trinickia mobilis]|uniref:SDR family oxidoreductase n=1 Tax=Trinickia mobilis TaxID=2816356 RepID=UPI001A90A5B6|nr:SDR family oxidoreductase [Trinickia mobilis]
MSTSSTPAALVTNATGYAGPPAVDALGEAGFRVLVHDRQFSDQAILEQFLRLHPYAEYVRAESPAGLPGAVLNVAGRLDTIVSNDHVPAVQTASEKASLEDLRNTFEVLVVEPFAMLQAAIPYLKAQGRGNVIVITSCRTHAPIPGGAIPDSARAAANAMVRSLAVELAPHEIAVNAIAPNFLYSEAYYPRATFIDDPVGRAYVEATVPAQRLGRPDEIGEVIRFLATTQARFLTGAIIDFNGAWPGCQVRPT